MASSSSSSNTTFSMGIPHVTRLQDELRTSKEELIRVSEEMRKMQTRKKELEQRIKSIKSELIVLNESERVASQYEHDNFAWSAEMNEKLKSVFDIDQFRAYQKAAINATMCGVDCLLIMPTGGGKSLCFQLPAVLSSKGVSVVISPLISLMEDQLRSLRALNIQSALLNSNTSKEEAKDIYDSMLNPKSKLKLLYVTPEKLAKSKMIMSKIEKMYGLGRLARLVVDEVHCCSEYGHEFRKDYKFLGIMKTQFPDTPILGLTATATTYVITDVQKMLNIEGCLVFKDTFYRPNLKYEVVNADAKDKVEDIALLIKSRFRNESGLIYCLTIKDTEEVAKKLRSFGIRAQCYHAQLESQDRSNIQKQWYRNSIQVIVATIAFGMGINKLDVRFVIHHSISKSLENYYQETGRAGRNGENAYCILFYRFADVFRATSLIFTEKTGVKNVYKMLKFALDKQNCRRGLISQHFGDPWESDKRCNGYCDNCETEESSRVTKEIDVAPLLDNLIQLIENAERLKDGLTLLKLMDAWFAKGNKKIRLDSVPIPKYPREVCEMIIALLLIDGFLAEKFHFTPYSTISYIVKGPKISIRHPEDPIPYFIPVDILSSTTKTKRKQKQSLNSSSNGIKSLPRPIIVHDNDSDCSDQDYYLPKFSKTKRIVDSDDEDEEDSQSFKKAKSSSEEETSCSSIATEVIDLT